MKLDDITPLVLTYNEAPNLSRTLARLTWAREVVVLDSGSTDATHEIAAQFPNVRFEVRAFDDHTTQWNLILFRQFGDRSHTLTAEVYRKSRGAVVHFAFSAQDDPKKRLYVRRYYLLTAAVLASEMN